MTVDEPCVYIPLLSDCKSEPVLPLNNFSLPIALINGAEDPLADTEDVNWLAT